MLEDSINDKLIKQFLASSKTIAMVGVSSIKKEEAKNIVRRPSIIVMSYLQEFGYKVIPVNPYSVGKKVNGEITLSSNKIYSRYSLFKSFESRAKFINGDIHIEQMLFSLGKLGAADLTGTVKSDKKFTSLKFENNLFIDNLKKFYNKFGIYNKNLKNPASLYTSGSFDLVDLNMRLREVGNEKKIFSEDVGYYEKEFNNIFLENGYKSLFKFENLKKFVQLTAEE